MIMMSPKKPALTSLLTTATPSREDPRYIARRIAVHAAEDVGLADPAVLATAVAAQ